MPVARQPSDTDDLHKFRETALRKIFDRFSKTQVKWMVIFCIAFLILAASWAGWGAFVRQTEANAFSLLNQAMAKKDEQRIPLLKRLTDEYSNNKASQLAWMELGHTYYNNLKLDEAISAYEQSLKAMPDDAVLKPVVLLALANSYQLKQDYAKALECCTGIKTSSDIFRSMAYVAAGRLHKKLQNPVDAYKAYRKALDAKVEGPYKQIVEWEMGQSGNSNQDMKE